MSFDESVFSAGFIQKTVKGDLFIKGNYVIRPCKHHGKVLEDSRRLTPKPLFWMSVLHRLLDCIFTVYSSLFDPGLGLMLRPIYSSLYSPPLGISQSKR